MNFNKKVLHFDSSFNYLSPRCGYEGVFRYFKFKTFKLLCFPPKLLNLGNFQDEKIVTIFKLEA